MNEIEMLEEIKASYRRARYNAGPADGKTRTECDKAIKAIESATAALREKLEREKNEPLTNADCIRAMTDEELSVFLDRVALDDIDYSITFCDMCNGDPKNNILGLDCDGCRLHWLRQPAEEEQHD